MEGCKKKLSKEQIFMEFGRDDNLGDCNSCKNLEWDSFNGCMSCKLMSESGDNNDNK